MRFQLASDLHLEFLERRFPEERLIEPAPGAAVLVLAGDIHNGVKAVKAFKRWPVPVLYVAGNHEFYDRDWEQTRVELRAACVDSNVILLDNDLVYLGAAVRVLGCTLWTDFRTGCETQEQGMQDVERGLNDYHLIRTQQGSLSAAQTLADHLKSRAWLERELAKPFEGKTLVITHHGPHLQSIHQRFEGSPVNPGFVSDLSPLMQDVDLWMHGHTHDSFDYRIGRCRVVANPAGYVRNRSIVREGEGFSLENGSFDPGLVVEAWP